MAPLARRGPAGLAPGRRPGSVAYSAQDLAAFGDGGNPVFLYVGRYTAVKRIGLLIRAYARAREHLRSPAPLVLLGGYPGEWEGEHPLEGIQRLGLEREVFVAGWHEHDLLPDFFAASDAVVLPSVREQFGQVLVEGMACGLPAIAVDAHGPGQIVDDGQTGWLVEPDDEEGLAHVLAEAANDGGERARRGEAAREVARRRYSWPALAGRVAGVTRAVYDPRSLIGFPFPSRVHGRRPRSASWIPFPSRRSAAGLYDPAYEHDACGVGIVARLGGGPNHEVVAKAVLANEHLYHRGATGADADTGDGAGILIELPDEFLRANVDFELPAAGRYGVAACFLSTEATARERAEAELAAAVEDEGQTVLGWRDVPVDAEACGTTARRAMPVIRQLFVAASPELAEDRDAFERKLYVIRRLAEKEAGPELVVPSFSSRTIVYKGMLTALQLGPFYPDLRDERMASRVAVVHSRYDEHLPELGARPPLPLHRPQRRDQHRDGQRQLDAGRESELHSDLFGDDLPKLLPVVRPGGSDSATFQNAFELLVLAGRSLPHAMMMMIPEAYLERDDMPAQVRSFYDYHGCLIELWDGPASVAFTDGRWAGATLDRNGLRPGRWVETSDGYVVLASEAGVLPIHEELIVRKGRLKPGHLFLVDLDEGRVVPDDEIKLRVATQQPYGEWGGGSAACTSTTSRRRSRRARAWSRGASRQLAFGYSQEDLRVLLAPMATTAAEPTGSMGNDLASGRPLRAPAAALLLLQAALRPGHQPGHRPAARDDRDEPGRAGVGGEVQPARGDARARPRPLHASADPARRRAGAAPGFPRRLPLPHD